MRKTKLVSAVTVLWFSLIGLVRAEDASPADRFLGSPLLILLTVAVIATFASLYHKMKK